MSDRDKKLLVYLGALIIIAAAYFLIAKPFLDKIDVLSYENTSLQSELADKRESYENIEKYRQGITEANDTINAIMDEFPEDNSDEKSIMFASHAEKDIPIWFSQLKFAEETQMLISGQEGEETQSASDVEQEQLEENAASAEGEETEDTEDTADSSGRGEDQEAGSEEGSSGVADLIYRDTELGLTFQTQYDGFKKFLAYIRDYEDRLVIKDIEVSYNTASGMVSGNMVLSQYALLGPGRTLPDIETDVDNLGTENVFLNRDYGGSIIDILADIASDFINMIMGDLPEEALDELGTDYFLKVNAVTDNTNGKTIGRADDVTEETYITSSSDSVEDVTFRVSGSDGSYDVYYEIGDAYYTDTIDKSTDGKLYLRIISTARMTDDDESAVAVRVLNESDIPVIVNIEGDDSDDPRVTIQERAGNVTVNGGH